MENFHKKQPKSLEYYTFFSKLINYFLDFRSDLEQDPDPLFPETDPDPYQNETDPQHWFRLYNVHVCFNVDVLKIRGNY